jgi:hypothetical protein
VERQLEKCTEAAKQKDLGNEPPVAGTDPEADDADILLEECLDSDTAEDSDQEPEEEEEEDSKEYKDVKVMLSVLKYIGFH